VDERYSSDSDYEQIIRGWRMGTREVDFRENLDIIRKALNLLVDMGFPERYVVQKFVADMNRIKLFDLYEYEGNRNRHRDLGKDFDSDYENELFKNFRYSRKAFGYFLGAYHGMYKRGSRIERNLDKYRKPYFYSL
jgi:hypothetical protein